MTNYVKRILYIDAENKHRLNPLFYPFLLATLLYGLGFFLLHDWSGVNKSSLYQAMEEVSPKLPVVWGAFATLAIVFAVTLMLFRRVGILGELAAMFGFLVWSYAGWIYLEGGFWLVLFTVTGPNVYFWAWYYTRVKWWERAKRAGRLVDAG